MSERVRARQSPLRDLMLELHKQGIEVKFYGGRPGQPDADVFFVKMPEDSTIEEHIEILRRVDEAMQKSAAAQPPQLLSYKSASAYVETVRELERDSSENQRKTPPREIESVDLQDSKVDVSPCQEGQNGRKKERQLNLLL